MRVQSPKPPFYETALLSANEPLIGKQNVGNFHFHILYYNYKDTSNQELPKINSGRVKVGNLLPN